MRRAIFSFWAGERNWLGFRKFRRIDPLVAARALDRHERFCVDKHVPAIHKFRTGERTLDAQEDRDELYDLYALAAEAARDTFGVKDYEQGKGGLTAQEQVELTLGFCLWMHGVKKNTKPSPTAPGPTDATSPASNEPTTSATSDSGSTANASPLGEPTNTAEDTPPEPETST